MSPTDSMFLSAEAANRPMNIGALALLSPPEGGDARDISEMFSAALVRNRTAPAWRRRPNRSLTSLGQWCWHTDSEADLGYHVRRHTLRQPGGMAALWELVSQLHGRPLDRTHPLWQVHLIEGLADGRYAVYLKIHHALTDGVSALRLIQRSFSTDPDQCGVLAPWEATLPRAIADTAPADRSGVGPLTVARGLVGAAGEAVGVMSALADTTWRALRGRGGPLTLAAPHTRFNAPISNARSFAGCAFPLRRLRLVAKHTDATVNDIVLTMCAGALRRYLLRYNALPAAPLIAMVPISLRDDEPTDPADQVSGNKIGTLTCSLATHLADPAQRLAAVQASMRDGKSALVERSRLQAVAMAALGAAPLALTMLAGRTLGLLRPANVMISNVQGPAGSRYWNGARLDALYPLSVPVDGQTLNITCTSIDGQVVFGLTGCRQAVPAINTLADLLRRELDLLSSFHRISPGRHRIPG